MNSAQDRSIATFNFFQISVEKDRYKYYKSFNHLFSDKHQFGRGGPQLAGPGPVFLSERGSARSGERSEMTMRKKHGTSQVEQREDKLSDYSIREFETRLWRVL